MTEKIVTQPKPNVKGYDRTNSREVYDVIKSVFHVSAKEWTPEMVFPFIPNGVDASQWCKILRNEEHRRNKPKPSKPGKIRSAGKAPKGHSPAEEVTRRTTTDSLFVEDKPKSIWTTFIELIEGEQITLWDNESQVIWEKGNTSVSIARNSYGHLMMVAIKNGRPHSSKPLAINPAKAAIYDYRLTSNAEQKCRLFIEQVNNA